LYLIGTNRVTNQCKYNFQQKLHFSLSLHLIFSYVYMFYYSAPYSYGYHYYIANRLSVHYIRISITHVAYQAPILGNLTMDLSPILQILYFI